MPFLAYYSEAAQASWEASPSKVPGPRGLRFLVLFITDWHLPGVLFYTGFSVSFFFFCLFLKRSFLRLKNYIFRTVSKNSRVHTPLTFLRFLLVFVQNGKKGQNFQSFFGEYFIVIIHRFSPNFQGMLPQSGYNVCPLLGAKSPYHLLMPASQRKDSPFLMLSNILSFNYDVIIGAAQSTISLSVLGSDQEGSLSDDNGINCYKRRTMTSV